MVWGAGRHLYSRGMCRWPSTFWGLGISPGLGVCVSLVSPCLSASVCELVCTYPLFLFRVTPKESWLVGSEGPAHSSQHQAARTRVFPPRGWYGQWQGGMEACPARRMLLLVGVLILSLSGQVPLRALCSLPSAEPGLRRGDTGLPGASHRDKSKAANTPQQGTPTVCLCINQAAWLLKDPQWLPFIQGKIKCPVSWPGSSGPSLHHAAPSHPSSLPWSSLPPASPHFHQVFSSSFA